MRGKIQEDLECFEHWGLLNNLHLNVKNTKMLLVGPRSKLVRIHDARPLRVFDNDVEFVKQYNYLGVILGSEMNMHSFFNHVKKLIHGKLFIFRKMRPFLTEFSSVMLYNHMILPFMEYAGFMILSCTLEDRRELQRCQNDALRLCTMNRIADRIKIEDLHVKCNIISLEQRRRIQLLMIMYKKIKDLSLHKKCARNTVLVIVLSLRPINMKELYKRSPYFIGSKMWNSLPKADIDLPDYHGYS